MSVVGVVETLAWIISAALAGWMLLDMTRVRRQHGEEALIGAADPLDEPDEPSAPSAAGPAAGPAASGKEPS